MIPSDHWFCTPFWANPNSTSTKSTKSGNSANWNHNFIIQLQVNLLGIDVQSRIRPQLPPQDVSSMLECGWTSHPVGYKDDPDPRWTRVPVKVTRQMVHVGGVQMGWCPDQFLYPGNEFMWFRGSRSVQQVTQKIRHQFKCKGCHYCKSFFFSKLVAY